MPQLRPLAERGRGLKRARKLIKLTFPGGILSEGDDRNVLGRAFKQYRKLNGRKAAKKQYLKFAADDLRGLKTVVKYFPGKVGDTSYGGGRG